jgi:hypothetical protein
MHMDTATLKRLKDWKQLTQFSAPDDRMFASTVQIGRLPVSYAGVWPTLKKAAARAGIGHIKFPHLQAYAARRSRG